MCCNRKTVFAPRSGVSRPRWGLDEKPLRGPLSFKARVKERADIRGRLQIAVSKQRENLNAVRVEGFCKLISLQTVEELCPALAGVSIRLLIGQFDCGRCVVGSPQRNAFLVNVRSLTVWQGVPAKDAADGERIHVLVP